MAALQRTLTFALVFTLTLFGAALAQDGQENQDQQEQDRQQTETRTVGGEEFTPFGEIEVGEHEPFDSETTDADFEAGAIIFTGSTPDDQHPNVDLVGPNGFYHHFEFDDDEGAEHLIDGLEPGIYSIASTDDNLQLVHTVVEVMSDQAVRVHLSLDRARTDFVPGAFTDRVGAPRTTFPADGFRADRGTPAQGQQFGRVAVETDNEDARFIITGPNNYSREFSGAFTVEDLNPGIYVIAGTDEGARIATSTIEVDVSTATTMVPAFTVTADVEEVDSDVAGGGEAEGEQQNESQDDRQDGEDGEQQN